MEMPILIFFPQFSPISLISLYTKILQPLLDFTEKGYFLKCIAGNLIVLINSKMCYLNVFIFKK